MEDIKNNIINQITFEINRSNAFSVEDIERIKNIIIIQLKDYDIVSKKYEIVVSDRTNAELWKKFFLTKKAENLSDKSLLYYKNSLELFSLFVKKSFLQVTTDDIRLYLAVEREKNQQKAVSIDNIRRILNSFFSFLNEEEYISNNPVKKIKKVKGQKTEKTAFTQLELEKLRMACENSLEKAIMEVLISSAIRATELANIKIRDIDFEKNEIKIIRKGNKELFCELFDNYGIYEIDKVANEMGYPYDSIFIKKMLECEADKIIEERRDKEFEQQYIIEHLKEKSSVLAKKLFLSIEEVRNVKKNFLENLILTYPLLHYSKLAEKVNCTHSKFSRICRECRINLIGDIKIARDNSVNLIELKLKIQEGFTFDRLKKYFGLGNDRLKRILEQNKLELLNQRKVLSEEDKENIVIDYNNGVSIAKIMEKYHTSESRIKKYLNAKCIFDKKNYELNDAEIEFLKENAPNMTLKELSMKLGRKGSTLRTILGILKIKYKARNCKGELWEWKGFN